MKTLDQITNEYPFSRITLERRMKKISGFRSKYCTRGKYNKLFINDDGIKLITHEKHNSTSNSFHTRKGTGNQLTKSDLVKNIHQLLDLNKDLKSENKRLKSNSNNQMKLEYHKRKLPSPTEWKEYQKQLKVENALNRQLESNMKHLSFIDWLKLRF